jgi:hypothetical protein
MVATTALCMWANNLNKNSTQKHHGFDLCKDWKINWCKNHWAHECDEESRVPGCHCLQNAGYHDRAVANPSKWF